MSGFFMFALKAKLSAYNDDFHKRSLTIKHDSGL